ncbi:hypothetical protein CsatA_024876 [Cannabis sativa]
MVIGQCTFYSYQILKMYQNKFHVSCPLFWFFNTINRTHIYTRKSPITQPKKKKLLYIVLILVIFILFILKMKNIIAMYSFAVVFVIFSLTFSPQLTHCRPNKLDDLIESTCKQTPNYNLCISSLQSDPRSSKATNVEGLGLVMVDVVKSKAQATLDRINQLLKQQKSSSTSTGTTTSTLKQALDHCALNYGAILNGDIPQATEAFTKGDFKFAQQGSDDAANEANLCENEFTPSGSSPITQMNKDVHDVALVTSSMAKMLLFAY